MFFGCPDDKVLGILGAYFDFYTLNPPAYGNHHGRSGAHGLGSGWGVGVKSSLG